jgi:hypothetical protein
LWAALSAHQLSLPLLDLRACWVGAVSAAGAVGLPAVAAVLAVGLAMMGALGAADDRPGAGGRSAGVALAVELDHHAGAQGGVLLQELTAAAERGIQRIHSTHHLAFSFLRYCDLSPW